MAKQKKNNHSDIQSVPREAIAAVGCEEDFVELLQPTHPAIPASNLLQKLSFSHFAELIAISDETKRTFYEIECIRGNWAVRELKRQINSLYYERSGLSKDKKKPAAPVQEGAESADPKLAIRDPCVFEFLGLKPREVMSESHLVDQLLDKRQDFLLELGHGFCFEARQKRILIGDTDAENGTIKPLMGSQIGYLAPIMYLPERHDRLRWSA
jgi:predicted nuclease of restriction endonuclease-like (RecB) superfamily